MSEATSSVVLSLVRGRRPIVVGVLVVLGLVVTFLALTLPSGDSVDPLPAAVETDDPPADDPESTEQPDVAEVEQLPIVTYEIYLARDPFEPVRLPGPGEPDDSVDGTDPVDPTDPVDTTDPTDPGDLRDPSVPRDPSDPRDPGAPRDPGEELPRTNGECAGGNEEAVCDGRVVSLVDIVTENGVPVAVIQVDSTVYEVQEQQNFAEHFRLLDIDRDAGRVLAVYGDSDFTLSVGERSLK